MVIDKDKADAFAAGLQSTFSQMAFSPWITLVIATTMIAAVAVMWYFWGRPHQHRAAR